MIRTVGIKYCGLCNPEIDYKRIIKGLKNKLGSTINIKTDLDSPVDVLVVINGCRKACIRDLTGATFSRVIYVNGEKIGFKPIEEELLADEIAKIILRGENNGKQTGLA